MINNITNEIFKKKYKISERKIERFIKKYSKKIDKLILERFASRVSGVIRLGYTDSNDIAVGQFVFSISILEYEQCFKRLVAKLKSNGYSLACTTNTNIIGDVLSQAVISYPKEILIEKYGEQ